MKKLAIIGAGDLGQLIATHVLSDSSYELVGFYDDTKKIGDLVLNLPILGGISSVYNDQAANVYDQIMIAIGYNHMNFREQLFNQLSDHRIDLATFIHSSCYVAPSAKIGRGVCLLPNVTVDHNVIINDNVLVNLAACISHDSIIGAHSFLAPRVAIAGFTRVGSKCILGINSTVIDNLNIVDLVRIGAGSTVTKDILESGLYVGSPVRKIIKT